MTDNGSATNGISLDPAPSSCASAQSHEGRRYAPGKIFPVHGRLHFTCHTDDQATSAAIQSNKWHYYFSNTASQVC